MPKAQVLVTLTAEAVVDVPADVDVEAYLRERVALLWEEITVVQVVQEPSASIEWFALSEAAATAAEPEPVPETPLLEASASAAPESAPPSGEGEGTLVETARTIGSTLGQVAHAIEELATGSSATTEEPPVEVGAEAAEPTVVGAETAADGLAGDVPPPGWSERPVPATAVFSEPANGDYVLERDELMALFSDPLYKEMVRSAVRDRAASLLEGVVAEVVGELEPLLRRQLERRRA